MSLSSFTHRDSLRRASRLAVVWVSACVTLSCSSTSAQEPASAAGSGGQAKESPWPAEWPRGFKTSAHEYTVYQPQMESWNGMQLTARSAIGVRKLDGKDPTYGVAWFEAVTQVDRIERVVTLEHLSITKVKFPDDHGGAGAIEADLEKHLAGVTERIALDELQEELKIMHAAESGAALTVKNDPPDFIFSHVPAILVHVHGAPVLRPVPDTNLQRVINTNVLLVKDPQGTFFLHVFDGWMGSSSLDGHWVVESAPPASLQKVLNQLDGNDQIDLLEGTGPHTAGAGRQPPSLSSGTVPVIHVATVPTELVVFEGSPDYVPVPGTDLLYANNTTGSVFLNTDTSQVYVLTSGRWFTARSLSGPWVFVHGSSLPGEFAKIPDDNPKENVKASVPGTEQASEALIANSIPQTAKVKVDEIKPVSPTYDGAPKLEPITGTSMSYVVNASEPVIEVPGGRFYCVEKGVWFTSSSLEGSWVVASEVPPVIYTIPASSPVHYVTYVYAYGVVDGYAYVGYTPGYYGTVVSDGVVVFGTGYVYPGWIGTVYYPPVPTYGYAANVAYSPVAGWAFAFGMGWAVGQASCGYHWGCYPCWGPYYGCHYGGVYGPHGGAAVWGPGGWAGTTGNIYHHWGAASGVTRFSGGYNAWTGTGWRTQAGAAYNSRTGTMAAGQRGVAANAYTGRWAAGGRGVATNPYTGKSVSAGHVTVGNAAGRTASAGYVRTDQGAVARGPSGNVYASHDGNVYRHDSGSGWQSFNKGSWSKADTSGWGARSGEGLGGAERSGWGNGRSFGGSSFGGGTRGGMTGLDGDAGSRFAGRSATDGFRNSGGFGFGGGRGDRFGGLGGGGSRWGGHSFGGFGGGGFRGGGFRGRR